MDISSLLIGFIFGTFTGAAATYYGNLFTDKRRAKEYERAKDREWKEICDRFPGIINRMKEDFNNPENYGVRRFFITTRNTCINRSEPSFIYLKDEFQELSAAVRYLEGKGYIRDITSGNCPLYVAEEHFVDRLESDSPLLK